VGARQAGHAAMNADLFPFAIVCLFPFAIVCLFPFAIVCLFPFAIVCLFPFAIVCHGVLMHLVILIL
jgi:hypothetical protein